MINSDDKQITDGTKENKIYVYIGMLKWTYGILK